MNKRNIITTIAILILLSFVYFIVQLRQDVQPQSLSMLATQQADVIWRGDAETGDLSQWCIQNQAQPGRISVVTNPVTQGQYAYRFELIDGDTASGERVTLSQQCDERLEREGQEKYFGWSVFLPLDYPVNDPWSLVTQFKGIHTGSPPISLNYRYGNWMLNYRPNTNSGVLNKWKTPATNGRWEHFVLHIKWSTDPNVGFIEFWFNGQLVVPKFYTPTMHLSNGVPVPNFGVIGLYRDSSIKDNVKLYHDGMVAGRTYQSVTGDLPPITSVPASSTVAPATITRTVTVSATVTHTPVPVTPTRTPTVTASITPTMTATITPTNTVPAPGSLTCVFVVWHRGLNLRPTESMDNTPYQNMNFGYGANFPVQSIFWDDDGNRWMRINEHIYAAMYLVSNGNTYAIPWECPQG